LSKNPQRRLGAGPKDAEEIKKHNFFKGVDWEEVFNRRLKPPKPEIRELKHIEYPYNKLLEELKHNAYGENEQDNRV